MTELEQIALRGFKEWWAVARTQPPYSNPEAIAKSAWLESRRLVAELGPGEPVAWMHMGSIYLYKSDAEGAKHYHGGAYPIINLYTASPAALNSASFVAWTGCGECDCSFNCYDGKARCIRLLNSAATQEGSTQATPGEPAPAAAQIPSNRDWTEDAKYENGNYGNYCWQCKQFFIGHKRRGICKVCATAPYFHDPASCMAEVENAERAAELERLNEVPAFLRKQAE